MKRTFGRLGWEVSAIGHGLWGMGGWSGSDDTQSIQSIERAIELGCNFFDTALAYGSGHSERLLGQVLQQHRENPPYVATKIPPKNHRWPAAPDARLDDVFPADYIRSCTEKSLANLGLERVDLQQFHVWTDAWVGDERWVRAVEKLRSDGLVGGVGISVNRWEPENVLATLGTGVIDAVQVVHNIFDQAPEDNLFPACEKLNVAVISRVPFDEGSLTGTLRRGMTWPEGDWRNIYFGNGRLDETLDRVDALREIVPPGSDLPDMALRFILDHPAVSTTIPGMRTAAHVERNMASGDRGPLAATTMAALRTQRWDRSVVIP